MKELKKIQLTLSAPKTLRNDFAKFNYRSCEGILEALKPLLKEHECLLLLSDKLIAFGEKVYIESTACLTNKAGESVEATAYAREADQKKGMDAAQISGSTGSYSRKYALNGLFLIDDNRDPDSQDNSDKGQKDSGAGAGAGAGTGAKGITPKQVGTLVGLVKKSGADVEKMCAYFKAPFDETQPDSINLKGIKEKDFAAAESMLKSKVGGN